VKVVTQNKKVSFEYEILEVYNAGIVLVGCEVKSLREGKCDIKNSFAKIKNGEIYLIGMHIPPYKMGNVYNPASPDRTRKLLLKKKEINRIIGKLTQRGLVLIPLKVYFNERGWAKVEIALARKKRKYEKREKIKEREAKRELRERRW
jgi:SsrA-binding protein